MTFLAITMKDAPVWVIIAGFVVFVVWLVIKSHRKE